MFKLLSDYRQIFTPLIILIILLFAGIIGYLVIDDYSFSDALYMTVITMATVGYEEVNELSASGRLFTIFLIITSFGTFAYAISSITGFIADGEFKQVLNKRRMDAALNELHNHVIICGYGRNGRQAAQVLKKHNTRFVVIENNPSVKDGMSHRYNHLVINGNAKDDEVLARAGIQNAKALITTLPVDADNLFIVLTARNLNPKLSIISRASEDSTDVKLKIAGADNVIMPDKVGGAHMASLVMKPDVMEFLDQITAQNSGHGLEEICLKDISDTFLNKSLKELDTLNQTGAVVVGFKTPKGDYIINPAPETKMIKNAKLFVLGNSEQMVKLRGLLYS
jgi:voltage-gated potassium channel